MRFLATADRTLSRESSSGDGTAAVYYAAAALPGPFADDSDWSSMPGA